MGDMAGDIGTDSIELSILMPCLDEAATVGRCVEKARGFLARAGIAGEVLVADNGSMDDSRRVAEAAGARVIEVARRGYGAAVKAGIRAARGRYVIVGDADDSYDFSELDGFIAKLREGFALVVGNRFRGGIKPGAMPFLNRYLGNPVLTFLGILFFKSPCRDFHCGLRGFDRQKILDLDLVMSGMELCNEMVVKAALRRIPTTEVPTILSPDGRGRSPHLRPWRDGWHNLKFLLMLSPRWLYLYPGELMTVGGLGLMAALAVLGHITFMGIELQAHSMLASGIIGLLGIQTLTFAILARRFAMREGLLPPAPILERFGGWITVERMVVAGVLSLATGLVGLVLATGHWAASGFLPVGDPEGMRAVVPSLVAMGVGLQLVLSGFLYGLLDMTRIEKRN
jgi:hypothetical protein